MNSNIKSNAMSDKKYIPNLDSLRGLAAIFVVVSHFEQLKSYIKIPHLSNWPVLGSIAVSIFFMLGGLLSTYFFVKEKLKNDTINYAQFFSKRYIRIWPLYFVILIISFFIWPAHMSMFNFFLCLFLMSNVAFSMYGLNVVIDPIWTLGAEDQFYLIHPQLFRLKNFSKIFVTFIVLIVIYITIRIGIVHFTNAPNAIKLFLERTRFDNLLLGGTIALMFYGFQNKIQIPTIIQEKLIIHPVTQTISVSLFIIYILYSTCINTHFYSDLVIVSLLLPIIYNLAFNANCMINIENKWLNFIGKISFSLYLSHKMIIYGILQIVNKKILYSFFKENPYQHLLLYPVVLAVTIFAAWLIYEFVEKKVLILKEKIKP